MTAATAEMSHACNQWYTPAALIEPARKVWGVIPFDPCSDSYGQSVMRAESYCTTGGLDWDWREFPAAFVNAPGPVKPGDPKLGRWFEKAVLELDSAVWVMFSLNQLQTLQHWRLSDARRAGAKVVIPNRRIGYERCWQRGGPPPPTEALSKKQVDALRKGKPIPVDAPPRPSGLIVWGSAALLDAYARFGEVF